MLKNKLFCKKNILFLLLINYLIIMSSLAFCGEQSDESLVSEQNTASTLLQEGNKYYYARKYKEAEKYYKRAIAADSEAYSAYYNLALIYEKWGKKSEAIKNLDIFIEHHSSDNPNVSAADNLRIKLKRELAGKTATGRGPLSVFMISYNEEGGGEYAIYNTSNKDVSITLVDYVKLKSPHNKVTMYSGNTLGGDWGQYWSFGMINPSDECTRGNIKPNNGVILEPHNVVRVSFEPLNDAEREKLSTINPDEQVYFEIPLCYRAGKVGHGTVWKAQVSPSK